MPVSFSWVELHGALTHFPIVFLLASVGCDLAAPLLHRTELRRGGMALLVAAVASSGPALLTGYLGSRNMSHPPVGFEGHWIAAVATSGTALLLLVWRLAARDRFGTVARGGALVLAITAAGTVSYTGYMGGQMVFGGAVAPMPYAAASKTAADLDLVASNINLAAERLDLAADKLVFTTQSRPVRSIKPLPVVLTNAPLWTVNLKLAQIAVKLGAIADRLPALSPPPISLANKPAVASTPKATAKPKSNALAVKGEALFHGADLGCISCHTVGSAGGKIGPNLTHEGQLGRSDAWQIAHLNDPASRVPGSRMPPYATIKPADLSASSLIWLV